MARAEHNRLIKVEEAKAYSAALELRGEGEYKYAIQSAKAIEAVKEQFNGDIEMYLRWKYINMLEEQSAPNSREVIYLPNGMMPIQETTRLNNR